MYLGINSLGLVGNSSIGKFGKIIHKVNLKCQINGRTADKIATI